MQQAYSVQVYSIDRQGFKAALVITLAPPDCVHAQKHKSEQQWQLGIRGFGVWTAFFGNSVSSLSLKSPNMTLKCFSSSPQRHSSPTSTTTAKSCRELNASNTCSLLSSVMWLLQSKSKHAQIHKHGLLKPAITGYN